MTDHKGKIARLLEGLHDWQAQEGITDASILSTAIEAQVLATHQLAEQQRIANLIALEAFKVAQYGSWGGPSLVFGNPETEFGNVPILNEIREGLGLS